MACRSGCLGLFVMMAFITVAISLVSVFAMQAFLAWMFTAETPAAIKSWEGATQAEVLRAWGPPAVVDAQPRETMTYRFSPGETIPGRNGAPGYIVPHNSLICECAFRLDPPGVLRLTRVELRQGAEHSL